MERNSILMSGKIQYCEANPKVIYSQCNQNPKQVIYKNAQADSKSYMEMQKV